MRKSIVILLVFLALVIALGWSLLALRDARSEAERNGASYQSSLSLVGYYVTRDSMNAATRSAQYRTIAELKNERQDLIRELNNANIRLRNAENITRTVSRTEYVVRLDTVRVSCDTLHSSVPILSYSDKWLSARLIGDSLSIVSRDSLTIILHSRRRRFLFWTWRKYTGKADVISKNPHTHIVDVETVTIEK